MTTIEQHDPTDVVTDQAAAMPPTSAQLPATIDPATAGLIETSRYLAQSDLLPAGLRGRPGSVLQAVLLGQSVGLHPGAVLNGGVHVIEGRASLSAAAIVALLRKHGHRVRVRGDEQHAVAEVRRHDDPEFPYVAEWTIQRAADAGLCTLDDHGRPRARSTQGKPLPWEKFPAHMLRNRAVTEAARQAAPEVLLGVDIATPDRPVDVTDWTVVDADPADYEDQP